MARKVVRKQRKPKLFIAPARKVNDVSIHALPFGGFVIRGLNDGSYDGRAPLASASTLDELLKWLKENVARPAEEPPPGTLRGDEYKLDVREAR